MEWLCWHYFLTIICCKLVQISIQGKSQSCWFIRIEKCTNWRYCTHKTCQTLLWRKGSSQVHGDFNYGRWIICCPCQINSSTSTDFNRVRKLQFWWIPWRNATWRNSAFQWQTNHTTIRNPTHYLCCYLNYAWYGKLPLDFATCFSYGVYRFEDY